ncbi:MAG: M24 family metallopeptidase, partial [Chloroflexota bacterium]|nr:M24 family metallopeptidase [Chloroflexota bacterium]
VPDRTRQLVECTRTAMLAGIASAVPGNYIDDISGAIEGVALERGYGVVRSFVGHGIGTEMHEEPQVTNFRTSSRGRRLEPGLCLAIEPMFTLGSHDVEIKADGWTVVTADGSLAAHWEHTIAVTEDGPRILTTKEAMAEALPLPSVV